METISVGIADFKVSSKPCSLESVSLGSCVGIALYDPVLRIAGLAHIMLPDSSITQIEARKSAKYADIAVDLMVEGMVKLGAIKSRIVAKIAGGASMFQTAMPSPEMNIGDKNVTAVKNILLSRRIVLLAEDTGKNYGRTLIFDSETGKLTVKSAKYGVNEL